MAQEEVSAAAAQAMKWMCQDCNQHLVPYLPQLHTFVNTMGDKLGREDILEVCEAIGYVIASMPAADAAPALQSFCEPLIQIAQAVADSPSEASKPDLQKVAGESSGFMRKDDLLIYLRRLGASRCVPVDRADSGSAPRSVLLYRRIGILGARSAACKVRQPVFHL
jgi:hypothetical protein